MSKTVLFQTIQFSISTVSMSKTVLFQTIQFSINTLFSSIWPIDRTLSGATIPRQSEPLSNGNEGVLCIPQSSSITRLSPSDCFALYAGHSLGRGSYPSLEVQSMYSTSPVDWAITDWVWWPHLTAHHVWSIQNFRVIKQNEQFDSDLEYLDFRCC